MNSLLLHSDRNIIFRTECISHKRMLMSFCFLSVKVYQLKAPSIPNITFPFKHIKDKTHCGNSGLFFFPLSWLVKKVRTIFLMLVHGLEWDIPELLITQTQISAGNSIKQFWCLLSSTTGWFFAKVQYSLQTTTFNSVSYKCTLQQLRREEKNPFCSKAVHQYETSVAANRLPWSVTQAFEPFPGNANYKIII